VNLRARIAKVEQRRFGRSVANLSEQERQELEWRRYVEDLSDEELDAAIATARAALAMQLRTERQEIDRRQAEGTLTAEEFAAWLAASRGYFDVIRTRDPDTAAELERAAA
jgi:hypothetical protein